MGLAFGGMLVLASQLVIEREDGTLLRAKATPNGMLGYLVGKIILMSGVALVSMVLQLVPALFLLDGLRLSTARAAWFTLFWVAVLGLVATLPMGAVLGSLIENPRNLGLVMLPNMGLIAISGIFYPINGYPGWLQGVAQVFPIYWLGLGMRSALLPDGMAAVELGRLLAAPGDARRARRVGGASGSCWRRSCCAGWPAGSPARGWPPAGSGPCSGSDERASMSETVLQPDRGAARRAGHLPPAARRRAGRALPDGRLPGAGRVPARACTSRCGSPRSSRCRSRWSSPSSRSPGSAT